MLISCLRQQEVIYMINIDKIQKLAEENHYLTSILKDFTRYEANETLIDEVLKIHFLARRIAKIGDDMYYEFTKAED